MAWKINLKGHKRTRASGKPFKCTFEGCDYAASRKGNLKIHQETPHIECPNCKKFILKFKLNTHLKREHKETSSSKRQKTISSSNSTTGYEEVVSLLLNLRATKRQRK